MEPGIYVERTWEQKRGAAVDIENMCLESGVDNRDNPDSLYETCVCCHKRLKIPRNQEIEFRSFYIEGAGQLCYDCYQELYRKNSVQTQ